MATTMLVQVSHMVKLTLMLLISVATGIVNIYSWRDIFDRYDTARFQDYKWVKEETYIICVKLVYCFLSNDLHKKHACGIMYLTDTIEWK